MKKLMIELDDETKERLEILSAFTRTAQGKICQRAVEKELERNAEKIKSFKELINAEKI
ncbi:MAG: hypothetical protein IJP96_10915 [Synergistaceae bacterium]|nr:hypothetical protein [Synergistaceae bacterium]MBQ6434789.1 hypothetical protein [Synergistaceae bacterium]MBR0076251.1 hypothetical protein [Synergistaceae bacterium]